MSTGWKREVHGREGDLRPITYERDGWKIEKSYYAHGASLFSYEVYAPGGELLAEFGTLARAKRYVDQSQIGAVR